MGMNNLSIKAKLGGGFGSILVVLTVVAASGNILNQKNKSEMMSGLNLARDKAVLVTEMKSSLLQSGIAIRNLGLQSEVQHAKEQEKIMRAHEKKYEEADAKLRALGLTDKEKELVGQIAAIHKELQGPLKTVYGLILSFNNEQGAKIILDSVEKLSGNIYAKMDELVAYEDQAHDSLVQHYDEIEKSLILLLTAICGIALLAGGALAWLITRGITGRLKLSVEIAERVADGDLTTNIKVTDKDEIGQLLNALEKMNTNLGAIVSQVREGTHSIATASEQIAAGNFNLSTRTEQQASSVEEMHGAMMSINDMMKNTADNATQANELALSASDVAVRGGNVVTKVVGTMGSIKTSSEKIVDIISVINSIAFQTNILALNAAVEAARAGEQGRGFAVVATEVRNLAHRSAEAAKEVKSLILDSVEKIDAGNKLVDDAGKTMTEIVESVTRVTNCINEITAASQEQSASIREVTTTVDNMESMTQQNAALVEEASAASTSLRDQASALLKRVERFKVA